MGEEASSIVPPKPSKRLTKLGIALTAIYLITIGSIAVTHREAMLNLEPNEWGDFLAGTFGPVAFLWLVLGYFQQGDELRYSAEALWLQGEELRNSVEQQRALVEVTREQLAAEHAARMQIDEDAERAAQPRLAMPNAGGSFSGLARDLSLTVTSAGPNCSEVEMWVDGVLKASTQVLAPKEQMSCSLSYGSPDEVRPVQVEVHYTDLRGNRRLQRFDVPIDDNAGPNRDRAFGLPVRVGDHQKVSLT